MEAADQPNAITAAPLAEPIVTPRLALRVLTPADADVLLAYRAHPETLRWMASSTPPTREKVLADIAEDASRGPIPGDWWRLGIEVVAGDDAGRLVGDVVCSIRAGGGVAEIGYALAPEHRGRGYASEAAGAMVDFLIGRHGVHRIEASLAPDNVASMRVLEAIGMTFECLAREACCVDGVWEDDLRYAMTPSGRTTWCERKRQPPESVALVEIEPEVAYLWGRLATHRSQERFVSPMSLSFRDALFPETFEDVAAVPVMRGVIADGERVGFVLLSTTHGHAEGWYLWRLLFDRMHQRRGIGTLTLDRIVADILRPAGVPRVYTSHGVGPGGPAPFYERYGFTPTGRVIDDERELVLELDG